MPIPFISYLIFICCLSLSPITDPHTSSSASKVCKPVNGRCTLSSSACIRGEILWCLIIENFSKASYKE